MVSLALTACIKERVAEDARIVLGAVSCRPYRALDAEEYIKGKFIDEKTAAVTAEKALAGSKPLSKNEYKIKIAGSMIKKALLDSAS